MKERVYITTTLPYVNADPHIGFALEAAQADAAARYQRLLGKEVFFNIGTDEHGQKIWNKAREAGKEPQAYVDGQVKKFEALKNGLNLSYDNFIRTTDARHVAAAQEFWRRCAAAGDIYKKEYEIKYCVGCELEKTDSELKGGKCPMHPALELETRQEENYFFRFSKYADFLLGLYEQENFIVPQSRNNEVKKFAEGGLRDFSVSRLTEKMPWGVPVPGDPAQTMYVWFDALVNYISAIGWPDKKDEFEKWWPVTQFAGKDNIRQQAAMWQAMLKSAGLPPSRQIIIHGFITSNGQKISKSAGNVIDPFAMVREYGTDALRYYLLREADPFEDSDFTLAKFKESYNANLANGLGNLVSRVMKMAETNISSKSKIQSSNDQIPEEYKRALESYRYDEAMDMVWKRVHAADARITETEPFKLVKTNPEEGRKIISELAYTLVEIAQLLTPLLPATADAIRSAIATNTTPAPLFARKN